MQTLSRNKKIGIFSLVILGITLIGFIGTGNVDMSRLSSSVLNGSTYTCTENGQKRNLNEYNKAIRDKQQAEGKIKIMSGEINVLKKTIEGHKKTIASHEETIKKQNTTISELAAYISKNCTNPKTSREKTLCTLKKQQKINLEQSNKNLSNQITSLNALIGRLEGQIKQKNDNIATWTKKIEEYTKYIKEYDACTESLKGKLIITSPLMSGEVTMSGEVGKRVELYKFSLTIPAPAKAQINEIKFDTAFGPGNIELDDWYVTENSTATSIYPCRLENNGQFRCALERIESGNFGLENGRVQNYSLSAVVKDIKEPGNFKIYGISKEGVLYNGTRRDADNQSTPIKINYAKKETSPKTDLASFSISAPKTVYVNEPFDLSVKALGTNGSLLQTYVGTIFFDINGNNNSDVIFPTPNNEYTFVSNDYGEHTFQKGITLKKAGQYELVIFELNGPNGGIHGVVNVVAQEKTSTDCSSIIGSDLCLKQDGCYYNEKTSKCTSEALKCEDSSDAQDDIFTKGMIWGFARHVYSPRYYQASYDYCTGDTINQVSCDSEGFAKYTSTACPNGCSDGACKKPEVTSVCEDLAVTPSTIQGGGIINYTCQSNNDILCVLDPTFCKPTTYSVVLRSPAGEIIKTQTVPTGIFDIPATPTGIYTAECFVNGQTNTPPVCKKQITNQNKITAEYVESSPYNHTVYVIPTGGNSPIHDTSHNFYIKSAEDITIRELTFRVDHPESVRYIWVGGPANKAAVIDGKAVISGLNQYVRGNHPTNLIQIFVQYNSAGVGSIPSNTGSKISITDIKYDNSKSERMSQAVEVNSIAMYIVGAIPNIYPESDYNFYGLAPGINKIGEFSIVPGYANSSAIKINEINFSLNSSLPAGTTIENIQIKKSTGATFSCNKLGEMVKCTFGTDSRNDFDGYLIPAGYQEIFKIYGTINGSISDNSFVSTKIDANSFNWDDTTTNGASGINLSGTYLPNNKMGTYTLRK